MTNNLKEILELHAQEFKAGHLDKVEQSVQALINQKEKEGELRGLEQAKEKVTMLRDVYLVKGQHGALDEDPMADKAVAIRNHLRKEINQDLDDRIKQLKEELKGKGK